MLKILTTPNPKLLEKSEPVVRFDNKLKKEILEMKKTLSATRDPIGVGLAAPQVGILKRIFLAKPKDKAQVFINPKIHEFTNSPKIESKKPVRSNKRLLEGCLSIPNIWGNVARKKEIKLAYQDEKGNVHVETFKGFLAIIIQHELDHLDGVLFTKHVMAQGEQLYRSYKNKKGEDEFEEIKI
jgi:peptide deformylase